MIVVFQKEHTNVFLQQEYFINSARKPLNLIIDLEIQKYTLQTQLRGT